MLFEAYTIVNMFLSVFIVVYTVFSSVFTLNLYLSYQFTFSIKQSLVIFGLYNAVSLYVYLWYLLTGATIKTCMNDYNGTSYSYVPSNAAFNMLFVPIFLGLFT